ncbi:hypothetical protein CDS [Bradyrhizobium sp.]|nr:hypothetical protein CDS [Bradyrhizobium sp.]
MEIGGAGVRAVDREVRRDFVQEEGFVVGVEALVRAVVEGLRPVRRFEPVNLRSPAACTFMALSDLCRSSGLRAHASCCANSWEQGIRPDAALRILGQSGCSTMRGLGGSARRDEKSRLHLRLDGRSGCLAWATSPSPQPRRRGASCLICRQALVRSCSRAGRVDQQRPAAGHAQPLIRTADV